MSLNLTPGRVVKITVIKNPASDKAAKTLSRIFAKDLANKRLERRRHRILGQTAEDRRRGGRLWTVKSHAPRFVQPQAGDTCSVRATVDVIHDLNSVARFVEAS